MRRRGFAAKAVILASVVLACAVFGASGAVAHKGGASEKAGQRGTLAHKEGSNRPWKGKLSGSSVLTGLSFVQHLKGNESHLGRVTVDDTGTVTPTGATSFNISGSGVTTAANGDKLFLSFTGSGTIDATGNTQGQTTWTITGGTGRFADASGTGSGPFTGSIVTSTLSGSFKGTISY